jgi:hypothetical protein
VWVGCLAHYNNGELIGDWVDAAEAPAWVCPKQSEYDCEEFWILDHEIPGVSGEMGVGTAAAWAQVFASVEEYERDVLVAWLKTGEVTEPSEFDVDVMRERYCGEFDSIDDYAWHCLNEGDPYEAPPGFMLTVDTVAWEQDYTIEDGYVFHSH